MVRSVVKKMRKLDKWRPKKQQAWKQIPRADEQCLKVMSLRKWGLTAKTWHRTRCIRSDVSDPLVDPSAWLVSVEAWLSRSWSYEVKQGEKTQVCQITQVLWSDQSKLDLIDDWFDSVCRDKVRTEVKQWVCTICKTWWRLCHGLDFSQGCWGFCQNPLNYSWRDEKLDEMTRSLPES